jgi:hypothetical protein
MTVTQSTLDPAAVQDVLSDLVVELRSGMAERVEISLARIRAEVPEALREDDPESAELCRESYREQLRFVYSGWETGRPVEAREPPGIVAEEGRQAARIGIKLGKLLLAYRICHRHLFEDLLELANARVDDQELLSATLREVSHYLFAYFDAVTIQISEAYEHERELITRDRDRRNVQLVRDLLDGESVDSGQLGYGFDREHLAVIAWGKQPEVALASLREPTGFSLLTVAGTGSTVWGWLGGPAIGEREQRALRAVRLPDGARLALGQPGHGIEGFRLSHRQAWRTYRIARDGNAPMTFYSDVALLGLMIHDPDLAREFVERELGPLAGEDARSMQLRETLTAYFSCGHNAASAAARLGVHDRTVLYRIRSIEERLGHSITARREELGVALRLAPLVHNGRF